MTRITRRRFVETAAAATGAGLAVSLGGCFGDAPRTGSLPSREFRRGGPPVSIVGLGGGARFFEPVVTDEDGAELVRRAVESGVTFIETSANYGPDADGDASERRIGLAMKTHRPRVFLETKTDQRDYDGAMREMERSLTLLQTDRIDLMLHHNLVSAAELDQVASPDGAERAIRKMVEQKVVGYRGFSCHVPALALEAIARLEPDAIQAPINATRNPDFEAAVLPLTTKRAIAVIAMKVVGHGFFLKEAVGGGFDSRAKTDKHPALHRFSPPAEAFARPHPSPEEFLRYALTLPVTTALIGLDSLRTLERVAKVGASFQSLAQSEMADISSRAQVFAGTGYWIPRQA